MRMKFRCGQVSYLQVYLFGPVQTDLPPGTERPEIDEIMGAVGLGG